MSVVTSHRIAPTGHGPRLLLFGRTGAGKSTLLGALFQAAAQPTALLKGRIVDESGGLTELARGTFNDALEQTQRELVSFPVHVEPQEPGGATWSATLLDSSGAVAQELLLGKRSLEVKDALARALFSADALILVVDAAAKSEQLEKDFGQFEHFLHLLQKARGQRTEVAGLPVFLVLTKCDLLARPTDSRSTWVQRIEEGKRRIGQKFRDFLDRPKHPTAFGALRLHLSATASRRPALTDAPARAEPYGVIELFREGLAAATAYHGRRDRAGQRLSLTVMGLASLLGVCALAMVLLLLSQPNRALESLKEKVSDVVPGPTLSAAERLRGTPARLEESLKSIQNLERDPLYPELSEFQRQATEHYLRELAAYLDAYQDFQKTVKSPSLARTVEDLTRYEKSLREFAFPADYAKEWTETRLAQRLRAVRAEYDALHAAEIKQIAWIHEQIKETRRLRDQGNKFSDALDAKQPPPSEALQSWFRAVADQLEPHSPYPKSDPLPGVPGLTFEKLDHLPGVRAATAEWQSAQAVLRALDIELRGRLLNGKPGPR
jgi:hypothetical protein